MKENLTKKTSALWLRAFFDAEAWVELQKTKSRAIRIDCVNKNSMQQIQRALLAFSITSKLKTRKQNYMWRLNICGKRNLEKFAKHINFLHPRKSNLLRAAIASYISYNWAIPKRKNALLKFLRERGRLRASRNEIRLFSIKQNNLIMLKKALKTYGVQPKTKGPWKNSQGQKYYCMLLKKAEVKKLDKAT